MSIASRITEIETHIGDIYDELEIGGADLTNVNKNIVNIKNQLIDRYLDYLNNGTQEIWDNWEKLTGTGTTLNLTPTEYAPMKIDLKGNTSQTGTPTPSSPIPINVVTGNNSINVCGKNLLKGLLSQFDNIGGTGSTYSYFKLPKENTKYTLTFRAKKSFTGNGSTFVGFSGNGGDSSAGFIWCINNSTSASQGDTFTINNICPPAYGGGYYKYLSTYTNQVNWDTIIDSFDIQLEEGDATTYEPYNGNDYEINLGKNLFDGTQVSTTHTSNWGITFQNNVLTIEHKNTYSTGTPEIVLGYLPSGTYVLSGTLGASVGLYINDTYNEMLSNGTSFTCDGTQKITIRFPNNNATTLTYTNVMLEKGSSATPYSPYFTPIELCKIGTYQDKIYKDNGKWYLYKEIGEYIYNGSENWSKNQGTYMTFLNSSITDYKKINENICYCDYYKSETNVLNNTDGGSTNYSVRFRYGDEINRIYITNNDISSYGDFKTWLSTHNTIVYYALETPTTTEITNTTLIEQLEEIRNAKSYENQTNISQVNNNLPFILDVSALKKEV